MASIIGDAGFDPCEGADLLAWKPGRDGAAVIVGISSDEMLEQLTRFREAHPHIPAVAVLSEVTMESLAAAMRGGATGVVGEDDDLENWEAVLAASLRGMAIVSADLMKALSARVPTSPDLGAWVHRGEEVWLRKLADGVPVADLAAEIGYSEREMFRMLRDLYTRIGVKNRTEAIIWATRHGLLDGS